jgi:electron transfer flavoprotein alpha/beta subunit
VRIAALVKQIPRFEDMELGADGRLVREGIELELNAYCRRAVSKACELAAERPGSTVTVITLGPPSADDVLREAIAWGLERDVEIDGVLVSDAAFAGSDTLATATALAAALDHLGSFDLILVGRNSLDADTGQVGPELAELLDLPFMTGVRQLALDGDVLHVRCEHDDGWMQAELLLPAVLSCAERLCEPAKVEPEGRARVPAARIRRVCPSGHHDQQVASGGVRCSWSTNAAVPSATHVPSAGSPASGIVRLWNSPKSAVGRPSTTSAMTCWSALTCRAQSFTVQSPHQGIAPSRLAWRAVTMRSESDWTAAT